MLTLHHLEFSRSMRVLWLLEELGVEYELVRYKRDANFRAPPELGTIHTLGKSPVIVDVDLVIAESSAILRYIDTRYGTGKFSPAPGTQDHALHDEWLDYVEGSACLPMMITLLGKMTGGLSDGLSAFSAPQVAKSIAYIAEGVAKGPFLMGDKLTLADMQMVYMLGLAKRIGALEGQPVVSEYFERLQAQPGFLRATEKGGAMMPPAH